MTQKNKELANVVDCFVKKGEFQKGLIIGLMLNEDHLDKVLSKMKDSNQATRLA